MRKYLISLVVLAMISGCTLVHRQDIQQGNITAVDKAAELHPGMTEPEVREVMGTTVVSNIFSPDRIDYVYLYRPGKGKVVEKHISCLFYHGRLQNIVER